MHIPKLLSLRKHQIKGVQSWTARIYQNTFSHLAISLTGFGAVQKHIYQNDTSTLDDMIIGLELYQKHIYQNGTFVPCFRRQGSDLYSTHIPKLKKKAVITLPGSELCKYTYTKTTSLHLCIRNPVRSCTARIYQNREKFLEETLQVRSCTKHMYQNDDWAAKWMQWQQFGAVQHAYTKNLIY